MEAFEPFIYSTEQVTKRPRDTLCNLRQIQVDTFSYVKYLQSEDSWSPALRVEASCIYIGCQPERRWRLLGLPLRKHAAIHIKGEFLVHCGIARCEGSVCGHLLRVNLVFNMDIGPRFCLIVRYKRRTFEVVGRRVGIHRRTDTGRCGA